MVIVKYLVIYLLLEILGMVIYNFYGGLLMAIFMIEFLNDY